jgi:hypothetical protein
MKSVSCLKCSFIAKVQADGSIVYDHGEWTSKCSEAAADSVSQCPHLRAKLVASSKVPGSENEPHTLQQVPATGWHLRSWRALGQDRFPSRSELKSEVAQALATFEVQTHCK